MSVGVVRKLAWYTVIPFASAADEFQDNSEDSPTLILVQLHWHSRLFPDLYFDQYHQHFTVMHDSGMPFNVGHPQRFVGALLHNAFPAGDKPSPKAKLPLAFLDHLTKFPIDSCIWEYGTGPPTAKTGPPQTNTSCGYLMNSHLSKLIRGLPMCRRILP